MRRQIVPMSIIGFLGLLVAANAQAPSPFDGTYHFVSSTKVTPMYTSNKGDMAPCPDRTPGPLTIAQGQARYTTESGFELHGTVAPGGELSLRLTPVSTGGSRPLEMDATGSIDARGMAVVHQRASGCRYDFAWQK
jgi:hypothetical protein